MRRWIVLAVLFGFASVSASHAAEICNRRGGYHLSYDGNFPMYIRTHSGATCEATFSNVRGSNLTFKQLLLVTPPARGKINLRQGGYYIYTAPAAKGSDTFTLRVCGTEDNKPGCATLNYSVTVE
jgi:hypothetical protein